MHPTVINPFSDDFIVTALKGRNRHSIDPSGIFFLGLFLLFSFETNAAEWRLTPALSASLTYSDNSTLAPRGQEHEDLITTVSPGFSLTGRGRRMLTTVAYSLNTISYARDSDRNAINHQLAANSRAELINDLWWIDGRASISQQNISLLGPIGFDSSTDSANRSEVRSYAAGTTLQNRIGTFANYQLRYQRDTVSAQGLGGLRSDSDTFTAGLTNGSLVTSSVAGTSQSPVGGTAGYSASGLGQTPIGGAVGLPGLNQSSGGGYGRLGWGLFYSRNDIDYANSSSTDARFETSSARLSYGLTPRFALTGTGGYESNSYGSTSDSLEGKFWALGFSWRPSNLTSLDASMGRRYYGKTYSLNFNHRSRYFVWNASYTEGLTTTRSQFTIPQTISVFAYLDQLLASEYPDPVQRAQIVNLLIFFRGLPPALIAPINFASTQVFLDKTLRASVGYNAGKTISSVYIFRSTRDSNAAQSTTVLALQSDFNASSTIRQTGGGLNFNWRFAPRTSLNLDLGYTDFVFDSTGQRDIVRFQRVGATHQFSQKTTGTLAFRHNSRTSNASFGYEENAVTASLGMRF